MDEMTDELFERGDFERTLKEHADRFFLIPSERVWKSIYNDLHPGSKWPSLAAGLFMFITLFWVGNTNREYPSERNLTHEKTLQKNTIDKKVAPVISMNRNIAPQASQGISRVAPIVELPAEKPLKPSSGNMQGRLATARVTPLHGNLANTRGPENLIAPLIRPADGQKPAMILADNVSERSVNIIDNGRDLRAERPVQMKKRPVLTAEARASKDRSIINISSNFRKKLKWEYVIVPMISGVKFDGASVSRSNSSIVYTPVSKHSMSIARRIGFTAGVNSYYPLSDRLSLMTGARFVYTGYNIYSEMMRPNTTSMTLVDKNGRMFSKNYISYYGNDKYSSNSNIVNYNWELSVPVGVEWDILPLRHVKFSVVSAIEPFMVVGSKAYMLAGNASRYVTDPDLVRKFNVSGNFGTMVSFSGNTVNWKIGPNFRYQILSTYNNVYPVKEHFLSYGIQVGVSKK